MHPGGIGRRLDRAGRTLSYYFRRVVLSVRLEWAGDSSFSVDVASVEFIWMSRNESTQRPHQAGTQVGINDKVGIPLSGGRRSMDQRHAISTYAP